MKPADPNSRIVIVDCLRGFALMGLFLVHMVEYFELYWYLPEPGWVHNLIFFLFGGKAYAIFSLLFGLSFFIIMDNQANKGVDFRPRFAWRLALLCMLGYVHGVLYSGDILQVLALTGFLLILLYPLASRWILLLAVLCLVQLPMLAQYFIGPLSETGAGALLNWEAIRASNEVYATGSLSDVLRQNAVNGQIGKWLFMIESGRVWNVIGLFLIGFLLGRIHYFENYSRYRKASLLTFALAVGAYAVFYLAREYIWTLSLTEPGAGYVQWVITHYLNSALIAGGVLIFVFAYQVGLLRKILDTLAPCGRITLTIYIAQSIVGVPIFYGFGLGLYEGFGQVSALILGLLLWPLQMLFAHLWMRKHYYGPLEWLWRAATYLSTDVRWQKVPGKEQ